MLILLVVNEWVVLLHLLQFAAGLKIVLDQKNPVFDGVHFGSINMMVMELFIGQKI